MTARRTAPSRAPATRTTTDLAESIHAARFTALVAILVWFAAQLAIWDAHTPTAAAYAVVIAWGLSYVVTSLLEEAVLGAVGWGAVTIWLHGIIGAAATHSVGKPPLIAAAAAIPILAIGVPALTERARR
jgi:hypothetical protein